mmetsp:Transcript_17923/g.38757  ORF Transcript_17923/g.38757 Transcript_17923/m.38757 type:complete len:200 (-) Transcript_17923:460-1059(-)
MFGYLLVRLLERVQLVDDGLHRRRGLEGVLAVAFRTKKLGRLFTNPRHTKVLQRGSRLLEREEQLIGPRNLQHAAKRHTESVADQEAGERNGLQAVHVAVMVDHPDRVDQRDALNAGMYRWQEKEQMLLCQVLADALLAMLRLLHAHCDREEVENLCHGAKVEQAMACSKQGRCQDIDANGRCWVYQVDETEASVAARR